MTPIPSPWLDLPTRILGAPPGQEDTVVPLEVQDVSIGNVGYVASFWKPNAEELAMLNEGKCVVLMVAGRTHPPLFVAVNKG